MMLSIALMEISGIIGIAVAAIILFAIPVWILYLKDKIGKSELEDIISVDERIFVFSNIYNAGGESTDSFYQGKVTVLNKQSGKVIHRKKLNGEFDQKWLIGNLLVLKHDDRFDVMNIDNYEIVFNYKTLFESRPDIKDDGIYEMKFDEESQTIFTKSKKGKTNSTTLKSLSSNKWLPTNAELKSNQKKPKGIFSYSKMDLLKPKNLLNTEDYCIVIHYEEITDEADFMISKINDDSRIEWTIPRSKIYRFRMREIRTSLCEKMGDSLIVAIKGKTSSVFSINMSNGDLNWKYRV